MNAVLFDTLALSRKLQQAGFSTSQAEGAAAALADTFAEQLPTRRDLADESAAIRAEIVTLGKELRGEIRELEQRMTIRLGMMLAAAVAIIGAMVKLL